MEDQNKNLYLYYFPSFVYSMQNTGSEPGVKGRFFSCLPLLADTAY